MVRVGLAPECRTQIPKRHPWPICMGEPGAAGGEERLQAVMRLLLSGMDHDAATIQLGGGIGSVRIAYLAVVDERVGPIQIPDLDAKKIGAPITTELPVDDGDQEPTGLLLFFVLPTLAVVMITLCGGDL